MTPNELSSDAWRRHGGLALPQSHVMVQGSTKEIGSDAQRRSLILNQTSESYFKQ